MKKRWVIVILLLVLIIIFWLAQTPLLALGVTINLMLPDGAWRPLNLLTDQPKSRDQIIFDSAENEVQVRTYFPDDANASSGIIINTPLIGGGIDDSRLVNMAESLARGGFLVVVPWANSGQLISEVDREKIIAVADFMEDEYGIKSIGLFGISYGSGPVFAAAADNELRDKVSFIVSLNGMADLKDVINFITTGEFSYNDVSGALNPHTYPREVLDANLKARNVSLEKYLASDGFSKLRNEISPVLLLDNITSEIFIIHSTEDKFIPYTESLHLHDVARENLSSRLVLTDVLEHGSLRKLTFTSTFKYYMPAGWNFFRVINALLSTYR